jgi:hypothetical protein
MSPSPVWEEEPFTFREQMEAAYIYLWIASRQWHETQDALSPPRRYSGGSFLAYTDDTETGYRFPSFRQNGTRARGDRLLP